MVIIQVTNKVLILFFTKKIYLILIFSQYLRPIEVQDFYDSKMYFFQFQYNQRLKFLYSFLYEIINFYVL